MNNDFSTLWMPSPSDMEDSNVAWLIRETGAADYEALHSWSVERREEYWERTIGRLGIRFSTAPERILDPGSSPEMPRWLPGARLNIVESCFAADPGAPAILHQSEGGKLKTVTYGELAELSGRVAAGLGKLALNPGTAIAIFMPMTYEAVAIYLGILQAGCVAVGIADSFRPPEIATRLRLAGAQLVFTQGAVQRAGKKLEPYLQLVEAAAPPVIVLAPEKLKREEDRDWEDFLPGKPRLDFVQASPGDPINILFSSGTTGEPKAIPWNQTTPIKCAADGHFHQDIRPGDMVAWPTNLGWMMGPWLIFASLINRASIALFDGSPGGKEFCEFVQDARVTMLGVIPSIVKAWRGSGAAEGMDWSAIRTFSSTGECSSPADMEWLMARAGGRPVIEYCGGTEIGGGYITGTVARPSYPGCFNTPALGLDLVLLDEEGRGADHGEVFLLPPSVGLSTTLLNGNHHQIYFAGTPEGPDGALLRRHGDQMERLPGLHWRGHGRADDTMNLGGIKVSSAEIERTLQGIPGISETAAVAVAPDGGPAQLIIYAVPAAGKEPSKKEVQTTMQTAIRQELNPLFKIHDLVFIEALPRTPTNKVMRRVLRDLYHTNAKA